MSKKKNNSKELEKLLDENLAADQAEPVETDEAVDPAEEALLDELEADFVKGGIVADNEITDKPVYVSQYFLTISPFVTIPLLKRYMKYHKDKDLIITISHSEVDEKKLSVEVEVQGSEKNWYQDVRDILFDKESVAIVVLNHDNRIEVITTDDIFGLPEDVDLTPFYDKYLRLVKNSADNVEEHAE